MDPKDLWRLTLAGITRNKLRGFLTMLGIVIGVAAVIAMIGIGEGYKRLSENLIRSMGTNMILVLPGSSAKPGMGPVGLGGVATLTEKDAEAIQSELGGSVAAATPAVRCSRPAIYLNASWRVNQVMGVNSDFPLISGWRVARGRYFTNSEIRSMAKVCLIGKTTQENLFLQGEDPVGKTIRVGNMPFEIIGVLESKGGGPMGDQDDTIQAPYTTLMHKVMGRDHIQLIIASALSEDRVSLADSEITALLRQRHRLQPGEDNDFSIRRQDDWIKAANQNSGIITMLLTLAAAISLIVGGVGITNIMLVSVAERTQEIGLRRAVGASSASILLQFLMEAVVLSISGGILGVFLALASIWILQKLGEPSVVLAWGVALGMGFSAVVGILSGFLPALKAARMDIVDAIRSE